MEYKEKLKHPLWQKKKCEIMTRDGFKCQKCGCEEKTLHVHHITYDNIRNGNPWECPNEDLVTWCEDCHSSFHHEELVNEMQNNYENSFLGFDNLVIGFLQQENEEWRKEMLEFLDKNFGLEINRYYKKITKKNKYGKEEDTYESKSVLEINVNKLSLSAKKWNKEHEKT